MKLVEEQLKGTLNACAVDWTGQNELLYRCRCPEKRPPERNAAEAMLKTRPGLCGPGGLVAYTVFLELVCEDYSWLGKIFRPLSPLVDWVDTRLMNPKWVRTLEPFLIPEGASVKTTERLAAYREKWRRANANARQRQSRAKKKRKIA